MKKAIILGILVLGLVWGLALAEDVVEKGKPAPNFTLEDLNGNKVSLSDFKGKVVLLNFWSMFCGPCREEIPSMKRLYQEFKNDGLVVVAVNWGDNKEAVEKFVKIIKLTFVVLVDPEGETVEKYPSQYIPYSIVIDRGGIVRDIVIGAKEWDSDETKAYFKKLLEKEQEKPSEFKLISPKELAKELRDPNSKRLKAWGYYSELAVALNSLESWIGLDEKIVLKIVASMQNDPEAADSVLAVNSGESDLKEMLYQNFEYDHFEQEFSKVRSVLRKIVTIVQENLNPAQEEHQKVLKESAELMKKLENPDLLTTQGLLQYQVEFLQFARAFQFIQEWLKKSEDSISYEDKEAISSLFVETFTAGRTAGEYLADKSIDKNSEEFQKTFAGHLKAIKEKLDELINFIETLPEK